MKVSSVIEISNFLFIVKTKSKKKICIILLRILHVLSLFINLILGNELLKKSYYLYDDQQTVNICAKNIEIASNFVQSWPFALKLYKKPKKKVNK